MTGTNAGADLGEVRWARTNPPQFSHLVNLLVFILLPACLTLSACVPVLFGYCTISVQSRGIGIAFGEVR